MNELTILVPTLLIFQERNAKSRCTKTHFQLLFIISEVLLGRSETRHCNYCKTSLLFVLINYMQIPCFFLKTTVQYFAVLSEISFTTEIVPFQSFLIHSTYEDDLFVNKLKVVDFIFFKNNSLLLIVFYNLSYFL